MSTLIPVASGKGGVGKSILTANLAIALAEQGHSIIAVDLDLGNSNLHSLIGLPNKYPGVGDFFRNQAESLQDFIVETGTANLRFVPGDGRMPFTANFTYAQKQKLIKEIRRLPAQFVLLDLSAGCNYNILDLFAISNRGILVTIPEDPSIRSMLVFLKNFLLRVIMRILKADSKASELWDEIYNQSVTGPQKTIQLIRDKIEKLDPELAIGIDQICKRIRPRFIYNMGDSLLDLGILPAIDHALDIVLSIEGDHFGFVSKDSIVRESIKHSIPLLHYDSEGRLSESIQAIANRIVLYWEDNIPDSANLLISRTQEFYAQN